MRVVTTLRCYVITSERAGITTGKEAADQLEL